jgi:hypothetical protein
MPGEGASSSDGSTVIAARPSVLRKLVLREIGCLRTLDAGRVRTADIWELIHSP